MVTHLRETRADPNRIEDGVGEYSLEDIALTMNFPSVEFVEESHHDERVEDDGEMLRGPTACRRHSATRVDVKHQITCGSRLRKFQNILLNENGGLTRSGSCGKGGRKGRYSPAKRSVKITLN